MSSLVERLRVRSEKRPLYNLDESDDDDFVVSKALKRKLEEKPAEKFKRVDAKEDSCQFCGASESLINCTTCTYAFHKGCLYPSSRALLGDTWSCPECVSPLTEVEKILDCEMRPTMADKNDSTKFFSSQTKVKQYLVKWKGFSYLHCTWVPEKEFIKAAKTHPRLKSRLNTFHKQMETLNKSDDDWVAIRPEWTTVDRVLASRNTGDEREYFVKWKELAYDECTWEVGSDISTFKPDIERYEMIQSRRPKKSRSKSKSLNPNLELKQKQKDFQQYDATPEFLSGKLHPYQLEGLNFLRFSWSKSTHVILADEMGLGKTIQSIAFLASLFEENISPYLVVAPLSTLRNWEREFATWAPHMNVVMYVGSSQAREVIRKYEFYYPKLKSKKHKKKKLIQSSNQNKQARIKFNVLLTSYEMINMDSAVLKSIEWECMIVDEGHRLKNKESKLFHSLKLYSTKHRVLLTGTPLQNNLDELFMLMHFLDAGKFASIEDFQKEFKDINQEEQIDRLHKMLAPHLLKRVKKDVMKDLPPKKELILRVELSNVQKEYYKAILTRNYQILARRGGPQISLINVVMELRKLCCHAYMLEGVEPAIEPTDANEGFRCFLRFQTICFLFGSHLHEEELDDIIRYGSKELFADESDEAKARQIHYDDAAIDRLLNRDHINGEESSVDEEDDGFLKAFKVANFEYIDEVEAAAAQEEKMKKQLEAERASNSNTDRANYWDELLKDKFEVQQIEELTAMGKGKRSRKQMASAEDDITGVQDVSSEDEDYSCEDDLSDTESNLPGNVSGRRGPYSKRKLRADYSEPLPLMEGEGKSFRVLGFNHNQRSLFLQLVMRFGFQDYSWKEYLPRIKGKSWQEVQDYAELFMRHLQEDMTDLPNFSDGVPKEGARIEDILIRIAHIQLIEEKMRFIAEHPGAKLFSEDIMVHFPGLTARFWKEEHDQSLLKAMLKHGYARWQYIIEDEEIGIADIVRRELNIPGRSFSGSVHTNENVDSVPTASSAQNCNGIPESLKDGYSSYQSRELQRRVVEFIRKRYFHLEKALEFECFKKKYASEQLTQDPQVDTKVSETSNLNMDVTELLGQMPAVEQIPPEELACDKKDGRVGLHRLYNEMCTVIEENTIDSVHAHLGDTSAVSRMKKTFHQLETIHDDVCQIIAESNQPAVAEKPQVQTVGDATQPCSKSESQSQKDEKSQEVNVSHGQFRETIGAETCKYPSSERVIAVDD
ncbi:CHD3-type chromatin-remodeling factor PICKLE-like [Zingiber officinale]|uniref:CHD3-type chromatin-remodeling factor PICKLE-like n=1 Tax=Zingiber officinale TaxID=94328 RepID=UPI001C4BB731|nr:CHD3-type chromatin-remodeling factor PICKLE-like [Zingiber officinale]